jgi:hypothetical protein
VDIGLLIVEARSLMKWLEYLLHHLERHLASLQCKHVSKNVMVPSVSMLYPDWIIQFQQDHHYIYSSHVVQNGYHFRPMIKKPLIAYYTSLQWTPLRIRRQVKKPYTGKLVHPPLKNQWCFLDLCIRHLLMKLLNLNLMFDPWIHAEINVIHDQSSGFLYISLKQPF